MSHASAAAMAFPAEVQVPPLDVRGHHVGEQILIQIKSRRTPWCDADLRSQPSPPLPRRPRGRAARSCLRRASLDRTEAQ